MSRRLFANLCGAFAPVFVCATAFAAPLPSWLLAAAKTAAPSLPAEVPAVVLLDETYREIQPDGRQVDVHRYAVRILNRAGRDEADGGVGYTEKHEKVESASAWLLRGGKEVRPPEKRDWTDVSMKGGGTVSTELRAKGISYSDLALDGDVFGYEARVSGRVEFADALRLWESRLPVLLSRFSLKLPPGWRLESKLDGPRAGVIDCREANGLWSWTLVDQAYRPDEPSMADQGRLDARLYLQLRPPAGAAPWLAKFDSWTALRDWAEQLQVGQCDSGPALAATARELTAGCTDPLDKMRALSRYVQGLRYVAIDRDLSTGGGCRPRKASEVHSRGWGDCKDKANLLRALLREAGIESFMTIARTGGGRELNEAWPSAAQFNHAILAIRVDAGVQLPAVVESTPFGRVLFFDATNNDVLLGDLPTPLQGSKVFVLAPGSVGLLTLPNLPLESCHVLDRRVKLTLEPSGAISGECDYGGPAAAGAYYRYRVRTTAAKDLLKQVSSRIGETVRGAVVSDFAPHDDPETGDCRFSYRFAAPRFAQLMPGGLMVVKLDVLSRDGAPAFPALERRLPVELMPRLHRDEVTLALPSGVVPEELPDNCSLNSDYGSYESRYEAKSGMIVVHRTLRIEERTVPVAEYAALRKFFQDVAKADHASVVLAQGEPAQ